MFSTGDMLFLGLAVVCFAAFIVVLTWAAHRTS